MALEADSWIIRGDQLVIRLAAIRTRIAELQEERRGWPGGTIAYGQPAGPRHQVAGSAAAAEQAVAASVAALRRAADAHDRAALLYEHAAAINSGDADVRRQKAASHRAAASADRRRAEDVKTGFRRPGS